MTTSHSQRTEDRRHVFFGAFLLIARRLPQVPLFVTMHLLLMTALFLLLLLLASGCGASGGRYELACPAGSKCYGARNNYSAIGYRGCIRTFDCTVQVNMVPQRNKHLGGFDYFYFVCLRVPNSTMTMYFTPDLNDTDGRGMIHAKIRVVNSGVQFKSFVMDGSRTVPLHATRETAANISAFHLSNDHLVKVKRLEEEDGDRGMSLEDGASAHVHAAEGMPILDCENILMFFSQAKLFYRGNTTTPIQTLDLKSSQNLYLKIRVEDRNGTEIENVSITLNEPGRGRVAVICIAVIAVCAILTCTKCCNFCACCRSKCCHSNTDDVEAQVEDVSFTPKA